MSGKAHCKICKKDTKHLSEVVEGWTHFWCIYCKLVPFQIKFIRKSAGVKK